MRLFRKIYGKIAYSFYDILFGIGTEKYLLKNRPGKRLMLYHGVDAAGSLAYNTRFISEYALEQQIAYFKKHFHVVDLKTYYQGNCPADKLTIALTFDDGYANHITRVLPILEKYQVPASFFVTAIRSHNHAFLWPDFYDLLRKSVSELDFRGKKYFKNRHGHLISRDTKEALIQHLRQLPFAQIEAFIQECTLKMGIRMEHHPEDYHVQLNVEQIRKMSGSPFVSIGSHSHTHADLVQRPMEESVAEMQFSKEWLESITGKEVDAFAFPYGAYNLELVEAAKRLGYRYILPVSYQQASDAHIPELEQRMANNPFLSLNNQIWSILNDKYR